MYVIVKVSQKHPSWLTTLDVAVMLLQEQGFEKSQKEPMYSTSMYEMKQQKMTSELCSDNRQACPSTVVIKLHALRDRHVNPLPMVSEQISTIALSATTFLPTTLCLDGAYY